MPNRTTTPTTSTTLGASGAARTNAANGASSAGTGQRRSEQFAGILAAAVAKDPMPEVSTPSAREGSIEAEVDPDSQPEPAEPPTTDATPEQAAELWVAVEDAHGRTDEPGGGGFQLAPTPAGGMMSTSLGESEDVTELGRGRGQDSGNWGGRRDLRATPAKPEPTKRHAAAQLRTGDRSPQPDPARGDRGPPMVEAEPLPGSARAPNEGFATSAALASGAGSSHPREARAPALPEDASDASSNAHRPKPPSEGVAPRASAPALASPDETGDAMTDITPAGTAAATEALDAHVPGPLGTVPATGESAAPTTAPRAETAPPGGDVPEPDADQITRALARLRPIPEGGASVDLNIASVGPLRLHVETIDGQMRVSIAVRDHLGLAVLEGLRAELQQSLGEAGLGQRVALDIHADAQGDHGGRAPPHQHASSPEANSPPANEPTPSTPADHVTDDSALIDVLA